MSPNITGRGDKSARDYIRKFKNIDFTLLHFVPEIKEKQDEYLNNPNFQHSFAK